jgi:glutaminyl-peptide cyclotransferase
MEQKMKKIIAVFLLISLIACKNGENENGGDDSGKDINTPQSMSYSIVATYPHDTSSFTEGLLIYKGNLYEGTGLEEKSKLMQVDLKTGKSLRSISLDKKYFGEGIVIVNDTVYQLTYKNEVGFMYALKDFKKIKEFTFSSKEGWGMTYDGKHIISSDGTSRLYFYEPGSFKLVKTQDITEGTNLGFNINELEYINGFIYANQWQTFYILKIDPNTGKVVAKADLTDLGNRIRNSHPNIEPGLNGIAYDADAKKIYITGKNWPELYEVQFGQ